jgi:hypothetical protein
MSRLGVALGPLFVSASFAELRKGSVRGMREQLDRLPAEQLAYRHIAGWVLAVMCALGALAGLGLLLGGLVALVILGATWFGHSLRHERRATAGITARHATSSRR